jgi:RNA-directed DNA polymerase
MSSKLRLMAYVLANAFTAGPWTAAGLVERSARVMGRSWRPVRGLARRVMRQFPEAPPARQLHALVGAILLDRGLREACQREAAEARVQRIVFAEPRMEPAAGPPASWAVPALTTPGELASFLGVTAEELAWFAARFERRGAADEAGEHYRYTFIRKGAGGVRLLEAPKARLKAVQRRVLDGILAKVPPHPAATAFRQGSSVLQHAALHSGKAIVIRVDLCDFFASIGAAQVEAIFLTAGYPPGVARLLCGLCTHRAPASVWRGAPSLAMGDDVHARYRERQYVRGWHLPQGAPTSPALSNLCAYRLDVRLAGAASSVGAVYSRYADDLTFSGGDGLARCADRFVSLVFQIAVEVGFLPNAGKTRVMPRSRRQQVTGVVVNARPAMGRAEHDRLKAMLTNCARTGPAAQNREGHGDFRAHLAGKIAWATALGGPRGERLQRLFDSIEWESPGENGAGS